MSTTKFKTKRNLQHLLLSSVNEASDQENSLQLRNYDNCMTQQKRLTTATTTTN